MLNKVMIIGHLGADPELRYTQSGSPVATLRIATDESYTDKDGNFIWPGFGDNMRVLNWIIDRCEGKADATETAIGYVPKPEDIDLTDLDMDIETLRSILKVDKDVWTKEAAEIEEHYKKFGDKLPKELNDELASLESRLN